jgi:hypothetical protein
MAQVPKGTSIRPVFTGSPDNIVGNFNNDLLVAQCAIRNWNSISSYQKIGLSIPNRNSTMKWMSVRICTFIRLAWIEPHTVQDPLQQFEDAKLECRLDDQINVTRLFMFFPSLSRDFWSRRRNVKSGQHHCLRLPLKTTIRRHPD